MHRDWRNHPAPHFGSEEEDPVLKEIEACRKEIGLKFDSDKTSWHILDFSLLTDTVKVFQHGATKYSMDNWKNTISQPHGTNRYYDATLRHLFAFNNGEFFDPESKLPHLAHAITNLLMLTWYAKTSNLLPSDSK